MSEDTSKHAIKSTTMLGWIIALGLFVKSRWNINISEAEFQSIAESVVALLSFAAIFWGRYRKGDIYLIPKKINKSLSLFVLPLLMLGCVGPLTSTIANASKAESLTTPASTAYMDNEGVQTATFQGVAPSNMKAGADGIWLTTPGEAGAVAVVLPGGVTMYTWSPKDGSIDSLIFTTTDGDRLEVRGMKFNLSDVARVRMEQFGMAMNAIKEMTREQAVVHLKQLETQGKISSDIATAVLKAFAPVP